MKETVLMVADFSNEEKANLTKRMHILFLVALVFLTFLLVTLFMDTWEGPIVDFLQGVGLGVGYGMIIVGAIMTSKYGRQIREYKRRLINKLK